MIEYLYAIRDKKTGKIRHDMQKNTKKTFWEKRSYCESTIKKHCEWCGNEKDLTQFEVVKFKLTEV